MKNVIINANKTYLPDRERYQRYVEQIFESGWVTNEGELVAELQQKLRNYLGVRNLLLVSSGTVALQVAYKLLNLQNEVITTPFSFVATTSSLAWAGLKPVFADIDPATLNIDPASIEKHITDRTSAILPVHVFGNACDVEAIQKIADKHKLKVIYDAAHAFGINFKEKSLLKHGDITILSFHATKIFHTIEGGALVIDDDELYAKAQMMINFGYSCHAPLEIPGINAKMNEFEAAMGLCLLDDFETITRRQAEHCAYYRENLENSVQLQVLNPDATQNYNYFPAIFESREQMMKVQEALMEENINARRYFSPSLDTLPYIEDEQRAPISRSIAERILCLPMYFSLDREIQEKIVTIIKAFL